MMVSSNERGRDDKNFDNVQIVDVKFTVHNISDPHKSGIPGSN